MTRIRAPEDPDTETPEHRQARYKHLPQDIREKVILYGSEPIRLPTDSSGCVCSNFMDSASHPAEFDYSYPSRRESHSVKGSRPSRSV